MFGLLDLDIKDGLQLELFVAGIVEAEAVAVDEEEFSGDDGRFRRFCHQVRAHTMEAAEAECRAYLAYVI